MVCVCEGVEIYFSIKFFKYCLDEMFDLVSEIIVLLVVYVVNYLLGVKVIVGLIESGSMFCLMLCIIIKLFIVVLLCYEGMLNVMVLYCGVKLMYFNFSESVLGELKNDVVVLLKEYGLVEVGDIFILMYGDCMEMIGVINVIKIIDVE